MSQPQSLEEIQNYLDKLVKDASELRSGRVELGADASYPEVLDALVDLRKRYDRVEEIYRNVLQLKCGAVLARNRLQAEVSDAWNEAVVKVRQTSSRAGDEYMGPRERYAEADLMILGEKLKSRKADALAEYATTALECVRTILRGLDGTRQDHLTWLRTLNIASNLEM